MKKQSGMRPLDVVVLMKLVALQLENTKKPWTLREIAQSLFLSASEVSESLNRSSIAGLLDGSKKQIQALNLLDFLQYGLKYVFPQQPGAYQRGMPTAHSAPMFKDALVSSETYVWPEPFGQTSGFVIEPLYPTIPKACREDEQLWALMALVEMLRVGKTREVKFAVTHLKDFLKYAKSQ